MRSEIEARRAAFASRRRDLLRGALGAGAVLGLAACAPGHERPMVMPAVAAPSAPMALQVAEVRVADERSSESVGDFRQKNRRDRLAARALAELARDFLSAGGEGWALAALEEVRFDAEEAPASDEFLAFLEREPAERYHARAAVRLSVIDATGVEAAFALAQAERAATTLPNASLLARDDLANQLVEAVVVELRAALRVQAQSHLARWIEPAAAS